MRRGCIAMQEVICDSCHRTIQPAERYLVVDEEKKAEVEKGKTKHYCTDCALKKDYAYYINLSKQNFKYISDYFITFNPIISFG